MKPFVFLLALLAISKIGYQEYLFRTSAVDVIVNAYRNRATTACQRDAKIQHLPSSTAIWRNPAELRLAIGKPNIDVYIWQINSNLWNARYRNPYLFLTAKRRTRDILCEYDIVHGVATVYKL